MFEEIDMAISADESKKEKFPKTETMKDFSDREAELLEKKQEILPEKKRRNFKKMKNAFLAVTMGAMLLSTTGCFYYANWGEVPREWREQEQREHYYSEHFEVFKNLVKNGIQLDFSYSNDHEKEIKKMFDILEANGWESKDYKPGYCPNRRISVYMDEKDLLKLDAGDLTNLTGKQVDISPRISPADFPKEIKKYIH